MPVQLLWFASVLSGIALAAAAARRRRQAGILAAGFVAGVYFFRGGQVPTPGFAGTFAAVAAGWQLFRPSSRDVSAAAAGILAAISAAVLELYGVAAPVAIPAAAAPAVLSFWQAYRNPRFAPAAMREEALLLVMLMGLVAAVAPAVLEGWRSASALSAVAAGEAEGVLPVWVLLLSGTSALLGGIWSLWRHR